MSSINWKLRLNNKATLLSLIVQIVAIVYMVLGMLGIVPHVGEDAVTTLLFMVVEVLALLGIVVDPTTEGVGDSQQAMGYLEPKKEG